MCQAYNSDELKVSDIEQDGWQMVFRGTSGNGHSVYHAWTEGK